MNFLPLSDDDWERVKHLFPALASRRGRPRRDDREVLNAILWIQRTGEKWHRLPATFPPQQTCYTKYITWRRTGGLQRVAELIEMK
ncbi:transposase [Paraburkholderia sp. RL17-347-BIC-D]|uniref:transposase n=1 Tax=Paraburkholderia sp. RL17-347-BIC-D TaxID=3031632 RepID=UPI0038BB49A8